MAALTTATSFEQYESGNWPYTVTPVPTGYSVADLPPDFQVGDHELKFKTEETDEDGDPYIYAGAIPRQLIENSRRKPGQPYWIGIDQAGEVYSLKLKDRFRHLIVTGFTGTGKSTRAVNDVVDSAHRGHGVIATDPGGEMTYDIIQRLPEDRLNDLVYIDPKATYLDKRVGFNLLDTYHDPGEPGFDTEVKAVIDDFLYFLDAQDFALISRVMAHVFRSLIEANHRDDDYTYTLLDARSILGHGGAASNVDYGEFVREKKLNPLLEPYADEIEAIEDKKLDPILRRMDDILLDEIFRPMFCSRDPQLQVADIFDQSLIVLVKCDVHAELREQLNRFFTRKMFSIISSRPLGGEFAVRESLGVSSPEDRPSFDPFHLVVDECHSVFADESADEVEAMFAEFRKRRVALTLLTQAFHQIPSDIQKSVQTNAQPIAYNPGGEPGEKGDVASGLTGISSDQLSLNDYHAWIEPLADNATPFICEMFPMLPPIRGMNAVADAIRQSTERWGTVPESAEEVAATSFGNGDTTEAVSLTDLVRRRAYQAFIDTALLSPSDRSDNDTITEWVTLDAVRERLDWYLDDLDESESPTVTTERLLDRLCEEYLKREPIDGTPHYHVTSEGRDFVFQQSKNKEGLPTDGGDAHHLDVRNLHQEFTELGYLYHVVRQGGNEDLADALLVDPSWREINQAENPRRVIDTYRSEYPQRYLLTGGSRYAHVEPEHGNTKNPTQLLKNFQKALELERPCLFVVGERVDHDRPTKDAELAERYLTDESRYGDVGIDPDPETVPPIARPGCWHILIRPDSGSGSAWGDDGLRVYLGDRAVVALDDVTTETVNRLES